MTKLIKCLIVDDEELARVLLENYIGKVDFLELIGTAEGPVEALQILKNHQIDLLFLDIQMPDIKGTDFAKMLPEHIQVIFTTAYSEYAIEGFELNALDYLLKPITFKRFLAAVNRRNTPEPKTEVVPMETEDTIIVKSGYDLHKVRLHTILYIESDSEYVYFHTENAKIISYQSLKSLIEKLPKAAFMRVHRSYIINKSKVTALKGKELLIGKTKIPVSASYYDRVKQDLF